MKGEENKHYAFVENFYFTRQTGSEPQTEPNIDMYLVKRVLTPNGCPSGEVVKASVLSQCIQLVPMYGERADPSLTSHDVLDKPEAWYVNSFWKKSIYRTVY